MNIYLKVFSILQRQTKFKILVLCCLSILAVILETLSIGLIIPFVNSLVNYDQFIKIEFVKKIFLIFNLKNQENLVTYATISLLIVYFIKNIYLFIFIILQNRFSFKLNLEMSTSLYLFYLKKDYKYHLKNSSSELIRNITGETSRVVQLINAILNLFVEILIFIFIIGLIIFFNSTLAITAIIMIGLASLLCYSVTRKAINQLGNNRTKYSSEVLKSLIQGLSSIKETLLSWNQKKISEEFNRNQKILLSTSKKISIFQSIPRPFLEILALSGLVLFVNFMILSKEPLTNILPTAALFFAAAFRLMPGVNKILFSIQEIKYTLPAFFNLFDDLKIIKNIQPNKPQTNLDNKNKKRNLIKSNSLIEIKNLNFIYENSLKTVLKDINFQFRAGEMIGIVGESGSGKTTLVNLLLGLLKPTSGGVYIDNANIEKIIEEWQMSLGYVPQSVVLLDDTIKKNIIFVAKNFPIDEAELEKRLNKSIEEAQLSEFVNSLDKKLDTVVGENGARISGGQKQRLGIARTLFGGADLLVFDEATSSLDEKTENRFIEVIEKLKGKKTIIIISHKKTTVQHCDKIIEIRNGKINEL